MCFSSMEVGLPHLFLFYVSLFLWKYCFFSGTQNCCQALFPNTKRPFIVLNLHDFFVIYIYMFQQSGRRPSFICVSPIWKSFFYVSIYLAVNFYVSTIWPATYIQECTCRTHNPEENVLIFILAVFLKVIYLLDSIKKTATVQPE